MGMFGFFRKKELVEEKVVVESFEDAVGIFEERVVVLKSREREVLADVIERLDGFYVSVEEKLGVLEGVDIEGKKEHERAKILVRQGLDKYVGLVRGLVDDLRKLERDDLGKFAREVGRVFVGFEKASARVYERATYLIGDEMMAVRNEIRKFYNGLLKTFDGKKVLIGDLRRAKEIRGKLDEVSRMEGRLVGLKDEVSEIDSAVVRLKGDVVRLKGEVEDVKVSSEYVAYLKLKDKVGVLSGRIEKEVLKLKGMIDFKKLIGIVHGDARELGVVKRFRDSFVSEFALDGGKFIKILGDCGMMSSEIEGQVSLVGKLKEGLAGLDVGEDIVALKLGEVGKVEGKIEVMGIAGVKVRSRVGEVGSKIREIKDEIVLLVGGLGKVY